MIFLVDIAKTSSITDWISASGVMLGAPVVFWGVITLFRKDRKKERQLTALEELATAQNQLNTKIQLELEQLIIQTGEFQHQTNLMIDQNQILKAQLDLQNMAVISTEKFNRENQALELQIRRTSIKPDFIVRHTGIHQGTYTLQIANHGPVATNIEAKAINPENLQIDVERTEARTNSALSLTLNFSPSLQFTQVSFKIRISYEDIDQNHYYQDIEAKSGNATIGKPELIAPLEQ
jgi:hypothetical protein